jgi:hypothetical protein
MSHDGQQAREIVPAVGAMAPCLARASLTPSEPVFVTRQAVCLAKGPKTFANSDGTGLAFYVATPEWVSLDCKT